MHYVLNVSTDQKMHYGFLQCTFIINVSQFVKLTVIFVDKLRKKAIKLKAKASLSRELHNQRNQTCTANIIQTFSDKYDQMTKALLTVSVLRHRKTEDRRRKFNLLQSCAAAIPPTWTLVYWMVLTVLDLLCTDTIQREGYFLFCNYWLYPYSYRDFKRPETHSIF